MISYITSVKIPAVNAQSVQIKRNCEEFSLQSKNFQLVTPLFDENEDSTELWWKKVPLVFKTGRLKYLEFCLKSRLAYSNSDIIYSRDILVCLLFSFHTNNNVYYEAHQKPSIKAKLIINFLIKRGLKVVTISKALKSYYVGEFGIHENNVLVAHDGVNLQDYRDAKTIDIRNKLRINSDNKILLHTGSLYPGRGAELFSGILDTFNDITLVHIGGSKEIIDHWAKKIDNSRFIALPHVSSKELVEYQVSCDLLLYPMLRSTKTYWCCSPMKIFEYMASSKPIICTAIGSIKEVANENNSYLFEPEETDTLYKAIEKAINDIGQGNTEKQIRAKNLIETEYNWSNRVQSILRFIERT